MGTAVVAGVAVIPAPLQASCPADLHPRRLPRLCTLKMHCCRVAVVLIIAQTLATASILTTVVEINSFSNISDSTAIDSTVYRTRTSCTAGTYLLVSDQDRCLPCPPGHFMASVDHRSTQCMPCYTPDASHGEVEALKCSSTMDTVVKCAESFFLRGNRCVPCNRCSFNDSFNDACVTTCCPRHVNITVDSRLDIIFIECTRQNSAESGNNDWRTVFLVGLIGITVFSLFICVWRGLKSGNRPGKTGCFRYKRVRTMSNSI
ncbi:hypothetical protein Btru_065982 [Bulinus truncatus]|nr:hypothetical protein Btru_065982 [Bulinus truncatus]